MPVKPKKKSSPRESADQRRLKVQQWIFVALSAVIILAMLASAITSF